MDAAAKLLMTAMVGLAGNGYAAGQQIEYQRNCSPGKRKARKKAKAARKARKQNRKG